jgi:hypothetical protein
MRRLVIGCRRLRGGHRHHGDGREEEGDFGHPP